MIEVRPSRREGRLAWTAGSVLAIAVVLAAVACQQILSIDGTVTNCKLPVPQGSCQQCIAASCCAQAAACADDNGCAGYESCLLACGPDYECRANCVQHIAASDNIPVMDQCVVANCESACGMSCGAAGSYANPDAATECQQCIIDHGCATGEACGGNLECEQLGQCEVLCPTDDCENACMQGHPDASAAFLSVAYGLGIACLNACTVGSDWACVGKINYPLAKSQNITLTLNVYDSDFPNGIPGLTVKACDFGDTMCNTPRVTAPTDAQGNAVLAFPTIGPHSFGFHGYFDIQGPGIIVPFLYFLAYPLSEEHAYLTAQVLTPAGRNALRKGVERPEPDGGTVPFTADDVNRGTIVVFVGDCHHQGAPGSKVVVTQGSDVQMVESYLEALLLSNTATTTDHSGLAFILDAPVGPTLQIAAIPQVLGTPTNTVSIFARAGAISYIRANPGPQ